MNQFYHINHCYKFKDGSIYNSSSIDKRNGSIIAESLWLRIYKDDFNLSISTYSPNFIFDTVTYYSLYYPNYSINGKAKRYYWIWNENEEQKQCNNAVRAFVKCIMIINRQYIKDNLVNYEKCLDLIDKIKDECKK